MNEIKDNIPNDTSIKTGNVFEDETITIENAEKTDINVDKANETKTEEEEKNIDGQLTDQLDISTIETQKIPITTTKTETIINNDEQITKLQYGTNNLSKMPDTNNLILIYKLVV